MKPDATSSPTEFTSPEESARIERAIRGDGRAFEEIVMQYQTSVYRALVGWVGHRGDAEDLTQETFLLAYRNLQGFQQRSSLRTWLLRIAYHQAISHRRKAARRRSLAPASDSMPAEALVDGRIDSPSEQLERTVDAARVHEAIRQLPEEYRDLIVLRDLQDLDYQSIAQTLEIPLGTVRSRLHRARVELKMILDGPRPEGAHGDE
ncbi:MAG: RNA polymerase sigma factor [Pirellulaceae bacterium]